MAKNPQVNIRVDEDFLARVDAWRRTEKDIPTRPEAIRRLAEQSLDRAERGTARKSGK